MRDRTASAPSAASVFYSAAEKAGVKATYANFEGVTRECFGMGAVVDDAKQAVGKAAEGLKSAFQK
jgi:hypothetical protein